MRNSMILFLAAIVVIVWFGSEAFTANEICATSCISLAGLNVAEEALAVAVLPVLLLIGGIRVRQNEKNPKPIPANDDVQTS